MGDPEGRRAGTREKAAARTPRRGASGEARPPRPGTPGLRDAREGVPPPPPQHRDTAAPANERAAEASGPSVTQLVAPSCSQRGLALLGKGATLWEAVSWPEGGLGSRSGLARPSVSRCALRRGFLPHLLPWGPEHLRVSPARSLSSGNGGGVLWMGGK